LTRLERNLEVLCEAARNLGATNTASFNAKGIVVDERVRLKCLVPLCDDYRLNLMCPPYVMSVQEFGDTLAKYSWAILIQIKESIPTEMAKEIQHANDVAELYKSAEFVDSYKKSFDLVKLRLHSIVHKTEAQAFAMGYRFAAGFAAGSCVLCPECSATKNPQAPCRHPFRARPSMEAVGIDVFKTAENAGLPFDLPAKTHIVNNGLILVI
jgi:predicted metal-binding protein